jgi:hypothetical protein
MSAEPCTLTPSHFGATKCADPCLLVFVFTKGVGVEACNVRRTLHPHTEPLWRHKVCGSLPLSVRVHQRCRGGGMHFVRRCPPPPPRHPRLAMLVSPIHDTFRQPSFVCAAHFHLLCGVQVCSSAHPNMWKVGLWT